MNANEITFGIEIECKFPINKARDIGMRIGGYHAGIQIPGLPRGWNAQRDGSILADGIEFVGVEIVSPVLKGQDGVTQVKTVVAWLNAMGAEVNPSCGFHVHIGFIGRTAVELAKVVALVAKYETALYAMTGTKSRENGSYCKPIKYRLRSVAKSGNLNPRDYSAKQQIDDRYSLLNLSNLANGGQTIEFRCFAGTLNVYKILAYVQVCVGIVHKATATKAKADIDGTLPALPKGVDANTMGEGELAVNALFVALKWKLAKEFRTAPFELPSFGVLEDHTIAKAGEKCVEMARKYDGSAS